MDPEPSSNCSVDAAMDVIGGKWKADILYALYFEGPKRFNQIMKEKRGISSRILSKQLKELENDEMISRSNGPDAANATFYAITSKGKSVIPILRMLDDWGKQNNTRQNRFY